MKKIIIFGGLGYIGRNLCKYLRKKNEVNVFSNKKYNLDTKYSVYYNLKNLKKIFKKIHPNVIFYLSGNSYPNNSNKDHIYDLKRSNEILQDFLQALSDVKFKGQLIFTSSIAVYGLSDTKSLKIVNEESKLEPLNYYGLSKVISEKQLEFFSRKYKINTLILRISSVYGLDLYKQVIYDIIKQINKIGKTDIILNGSKKDSRQMIFIEDVVLIINKLIKKKYRFQILNLAQGKKIKILFIANYLIKNSLTSKKIIFKSNLNAESFPLLSNKRLLKEIGNYNFTSIEKGLLKTLRHFKISSK
jgi:UDP-glucose 4-epimerase